jgi:predicted CopG family antitoxin
LARIRKNISIDEDVFEKAQVKCEKMFSGNFSMYLTYLINKDTENIEIPKVNKSIKESEEAVDKEVKSEIDNILNL